jgi:hypothetical protein
MHAYVPDRRLLLQAFPLDFRLPGLLAAAGDAWLDRALGGEPGAATLLEVDPVSYKPWLRCVLRYSVEIGGRERRFFGKVFREHPGPDTEATLRTLGERLHATGSPWQIAAPVRYLAPERLLVLEEPAHDVDLQTLLGRAEEDVSARRRLLAAVARTAEGLVRFQETAVAGICRLDPATLVARLERRSARFARVAPSFTRLFADRLAVLATEVDRLEPEPTALTHGAFRHEHVVLSEDQLVILDLDGLALAGASSDAGSFLAYLDVTALRSHALRSVVSECHEAFLSTLERETHVRYDWLAWYRSVAELKWALDAAASLDPQWPELVDALLSSSTAPAMTSLTVGTQ